MNSQGREPLEQKRRGYISLGLEVPGLIPLPFQGKSRGRGVPLWHENVHIGQGLRGGLLTTGPVGATRCLHRVSVLEQAKTHTRERVVCPLRTEMEHSA